MHIPRQLVVACIVCGGILLFRQAAASWPAAGVPVCEIPGDGPANPLIVAGQAGESFVIWDDGRQLTSNGLILIFCQRLTATGEVAAGWPADGKLVVGTPALGIDAAISDGSGGLYVVYEMLIDHNDVYAQHLNGNGDPVAGWPAGGRIIQGGPYEQRFASAALDDSGGVFIVWQDDLSGIRGIRLHPDGTVAPGWVEGGKVLSTPLSSGGSDPFMASDGLGGIVAVWNEERTTPTQFDEAEYGFRFTAGGDPYPGWPTGVRLLQQVLINQPARVTADGSGGLYAAWGDFRNAPPGVTPFQNPSYFDVYGQHVQGDGTIAPGWPADALPICTAPLESWNPILEGDGHGGVIVEWEDYRNLFEQVYAIRLKTDGTRVTGWAVNGNLVTTLPDYVGEANLVTDGASGAYFGLNDSGTGLCGVQHLEGDGSFDPLFGDAGLPVTTAAGGQRSAWVAADGQGGTYSAWEDERDARLTGTEIWANHFGAGIVTAIAVSLMSSEVAPDHVTLVWQAPQSLRATVERREGTGPWQTLWDVTTDGQDRLVYDDRSVTPGTSYGYRLSYVDGTTTEHTAETTVMVPRAYTLALSGFRPNPASSADLAISFELPSVAPGRLELLDVTGRRVAERDLSSYGAGRYTERIGEGARVPAGTYWVRLTHGGKALTARGVVLQ